MRRIGANPLEHAYRADAGDLAREDRLDEGRRNERLRGEIVYLVRLTLSHRGVQRRLVDEIAIQERDAVHEVLDVADIGDAQAADEPMDFVAFLQEEFHEERAVLARGAGDKSGLCHRAANPSSALYRIGATRERVLRDLPERIEEAFHVLQNESLNEPRGPSHVVLFRCPRRGDRGPTSRVRFPSLPGKWQRRTVGRGRCTHPAWTASPHRPGTRCAMRMRPRSAGVRNRSFRRRSFRDDRLHPSRGRTSPRPSLRRGSCRSPRHGRTNDAPTACIQVPHGRLWHLAGHRHVLCGIQRRYVSFRAVSLRESANDRQSLSRKTSKDLELELDPLLRIEPIHGQPCVTESIESKARRLDGRMDDVCLAMVISSNACLDVLAVHDDAVARSHRTTVPCSVEGGPCARKEPAAEWETCLHRIALVVEHPGRRVAIVEVRMVATRGVMSPVPREYVCRVARGPCPREHPARVNLLERRTRVESAERDDVDVPEPCPSGQLGVVRRRDEVRIEMARKGQDEALRAADRLHVVVEDRETHRGTRGAKSPSPATPHRFYISPRRLTPGRCSRAGSPEVESGMWA